MNALDLYQQRLFEFDKAFALRESWPQRHPDGALNQARFAEAHFLTGRFAEAGRQLTVMVLKDELVPQYMIPLRVLEVVTLTAVGEMKEVPARLVALRQAIAGRPAGVALG